MELNTATGTVCGFSDAIVAGLTGLLDREMLAIPSRCAFHLQQGTP
jgi:hypothetical protein